MDSAPRSALRRPELVADGAPTTAPSHEAARGLPVTAVYQLSEAGRKASLLTGGDGRANQQLAVQVPTSRLHLVSVDPHGVARLKLRPRFEMDAEQRVIRVDAGPTYDAPPTLEDLFREAARNHELERVYQAERTVSRAMKREAERERRAQVAEAFLADKSQRALVHPAPSPRRCTLVAAQGRMLFDVTTDEGVARDVPAEAHRRFRADLAAKKEKNLHERAAQLALHEEKKRFIAEWIEKNGTPDQKERQTAGMLPAAEVIEAITVQAFAAATGYCLYKRDGLERLQQHLRTSPAHVGIALSRSDLLVASSDSRRATSNQWAALHDIRRRIPGAEATIRSHSVASRQAPNGPSIVLHSLLVTLRIGPLLLRREYALPED